MRKICSSLKTDGFGAQYWANMTCIAYCRNNNFIYRHSNYIRIRHFDRNTEKLLLPNLLNEFTGLKSDEDDDINREIDDKKAWTFPYSNNSDEWFSPSIIQEIRKMYYSTSKPKIIECDVAIHIRRGDVQENNINRTRFRPLSYYKNIIDKLKQKNKNCKFAIFSEGKIEDFKEIQDENIEFHLNEDLLISFHSMVKANIFVMGYSCLSLCIAILNENTVIYMKNQFKPLKKWIIM